MAVRETREQLELLIAPLQEKGLPVKLEVLCGKPFIEVIRAVLRRQHDLVMMTADKERIDLIVMGTVARTGIEGYFMGNTAEAVLQRVACSVLTVKPEGFVSPVKLD